MISNTFSGIERTIEELLSREGLHELANFARDSFIQIFVGELPIKQKPGCILDDPHVHYPHPKNMNELEETVRTIAKRLGRSAITKWAMTPEDEEAVKNVLRYEFLIENIQNVSPDIRLDFRGEVSIIHIGDNKVQVYPSQEIRTTSSINGFYPHITAEGCLQSIKSGQDARKTIELVHDLGGIAIIEHNTTKTHPILQYTLTNPNEDRFTRELFDMADATEVFNSYNTFHMVASNAAAKKEADSYKIAKVAGSDLHFGASSNSALKAHKKRIGKTGIWLPEHDLQSLTGKEILELKRNDLKTGNYERLETYTDPWTFFITMVPPILYRTLAHRANKLGIKTKLHTDSIS